LHHNFAVSLTQGLFWPCFLSKVEDLVWKGEDLLKPGCWWVGLFFPTPFFAKGQNPRFRSRDVGRWKTTPLLWISNLAENQTRVVPPTGISPLFPPRLFCSSTPKKKTWNLPFFPARNFPSGEGADPAFPPPKKPLWEHHNSFSLDE